MDVYDTDKVLLPLPQLRPLHYRYALGWQMRVGANGMGAGAGAGAGSNANAQTNSGEIVAGGGTGTVTGTITTTPRGDKTRNLPGLARLAGLAGLMTTPVQTLPIPAGIPVGIPAEAPPGPPARIPPGLPPGLPPCSTGHSCRLCGKCFKRKSWLRRHLLSHSPERHFACPWCLSKHKRKDNLLQHMKVKHTKYVLQELRQRNVVIEGEVGKDSIRTLLCDGRLNKEDVKSVLNRLIEPQE